MAGAGVRAFGGVLVSGYSEIAQVSGKAFQNCAEPWMAELKRHMDVLERVLESFISSLQPTN